MQTKSCFVIMPFGEKTDVNGEVIPFDTVYEHILKPAGKKLESHGISVNTVRCDETDSLVHQVLSDLKVQCGDPTGGAGMEIQKSDRIEYRLQNAPTQRIAIITGDLRNVRGMDVWVNAENTNMQMARFYDRSMSG